jgi:hypothetical protein
MKEELLKFVMQLPSVTDLGMKPESLSCIPKRIVTDDKSRFYFPKRTSYSFETVNDHDFSFLMFVTYF